MIVFVFSLVLACETNEPSPTKQRTTDLTWHADVRPLVERSCLGCHNGSGVGRFSLETYTDFADWSVATRDAVANRTMPPWHADPNCNDYEGDFSLSDAEIEAVVGWIDGGMPEGDAADYPGVTDPFMPTALDRVDLTLSMPEVYAPTGTPDDYRCFLMEWPYTDPVWVTGYDFLPGNPDIVHHIIPFIIPPGEADNYRALDAADSGAGYSCYGSPGGDVRALERLRWLGAWSPGTSAINLPDGKGLQIKPGALIAVQVHYYAANPGETDQSGIQLKVSPEPQQWADVQPWTDILWVLGAGMEIPANTEGVEHTFEYTLGPWESFRISQAMLHMHTLARSGRMSIVHSDGTETCVLDVPRYDFDWQRSYRLREPITVNPGDTVKLSCIWDNPGDQDVSWGDGTGDEMCLGVTELID